jgi:hypothetical protein
MREKEREELLRLSIETWVSAVSNVSVSKKAASQKTALHFATRVIINLTKTIKKSSKSWRDQDKRRNIPLHPPTWTHCSWHFDNDCTFHHMFLKLVTSSQTRFHGCCWLVCISQHTGGFPPWELQFSFACNYLIASHERFRTVSAFVDTILNQSSIDLDRHIQGIYQVFFFITPFLLSRKFLPGSSSRAEPIGWSSRALPSMANHCARWLCIWLWDICNLALEKVALTPFGRWRTELAWELFPHPTLFWEKQQNEDNTRKVVWSTIENGNLSTVHYCSTFPEWERNTHK